MGLWKTAVRSRTVTLEAADILTLDTIPVEVIPAPAQGEMIVVQSIFNKQVVRDTPFAGSGSVYLYFNGDDERAYPISYVYVPMTLTANVENSPTPFINIPLSVAENSAVILLSPNQITDGDGAIVLTIYYSIVNLSQGND